MYKDYIELIEGLEENIQVFEEYAGKQAAILKDLDSVEELRQALYEKYHNKFQYVNEEEAHPYTQEEIEEIKSELLDNSILTIIKRFLGIGKRQDVIYAELMGKIKGLTLYLQEQEQEMRRQEDEAGFAIQDYGEAILRGYQETMDAAGYAQDSDWEKYVTPENGANILYFGNVDVLLEAEREYCGEWIGDVLGECYADDFIQVPYTRDSRKPLQFYCEYQGEETRRTATGLLRSLIYQEMRQMQEYSLEFHLIDGENTGNDLSELLGLKQIREGDVWQLNRKVTGNVYKYASLYLNNQDISQGLKALDRYLGLVAEETAGFSSVEEYNASPEAQEKGMIPQQMVVIQNFPAGFSDSDIELLNKLIKNGSQRGVSVFIQYDSRHKKLFREKVDMPTQNIMDGITIEKEGAHITAGDCSSAIEPKIMESGKKEYVQSLIEEKTKIREVDNRFQALMDVEGPFGERDATKGIRIPFAVDKRGEIKELVLGNSAHAHGLISGTTGSGKSTLLHMIISSVAMNYKPEDVEMWLVDYKINEFSSYKYNTPPHVKFLGLSKGTDFTFALLDKIWAEYERRQQLVKKADEEMKKRGENTNITSITDYRKYMGLQGMSRLLIIIDEFHVMAQQVSEDYAYKEKLENLLAEGRAMGITFLFSDQTVTVGLKGLTEKGRKQIKCRIAMANDKDEMREMLPNISSEDLTHFLNLKVGECALVTYENVRGDNGQLEEKQSIERVKNIYIDGETRYALCQNIRSFFQAEDYLPVYMDETEKKSYSLPQIQQWEEKNLGRVDYSRQIPLYWGEALDLTGCFMVPLLHRRGENIMSVGGTEEEQMQLLMSQVYSMQRIPGHRIIVLADSYSRLFDLCEEKLLDLQEEDSGVEVYSSLEDICRIVNELTESFRDRRRENRILVIWIGLEDLYDEFRNAPDTKPRAFKNSHREKQKDVNDLLDEKWNQLFGEDFLSETDSDLEEEPEDEEELIYNALEDISSLLHTGPRSGIFHSIIYDTVYPVKHNREISMENFRHKFAFALGRDDCLEFLGRSNLLEGMEQQKGVAAYFDGKIVRKFIPYEV